MDTIRWNDCKAYVSQFWMTLNTYLNRFRSVKHSNHAMLWNAQKHFNSIVPSLACILAKQHIFRCGKYLLKTPGNAIPETLSSRTCAFCAISRASYYSLSALYLKTFWQPWGLVGKKWNSYEFVLVLFSFFFWWKTHSSWGSVAGGNPKPLVLSDRPVWILVLFCKLKWTAKQPFCISKTESSCTWAKHFSGGKKSFFCWAWADCRL